MKLALLIEFLAALALASHRGQWDGKNGILLIEPRSGGVLGCCQAVVFFVLGLLLYLGGFIMWLGNQLQNTLRATK